tara:strand:+ start:516 stop:953 length:438 start_codon:yes stop_codon:yes gene_type:complete
VSAQWTYEVEASDDGADRGVGLASEAVDILNVDHINLVVDVEALDVLPVPLDHVDELIAAVESREREKEERESVREEGRKEGRKQQQRRKEKKQREGGEEEDGIGKRKGRHRRWRPEERTGSKSHTHTHKRNTRTLHLRERGHRS